MKTIQKYLTKNIISVIIASAIFALVGCGDYVDTTSNPGQSGTTLEIINNSGKALELACWFDDNSVEYEFSNTTIHDNLEGMDLKALANGTSQKMNVEAGNSYLYFFLPEDGKLYRSTNAIKVSAGENISFEVTTSNFRPIGHTVTIYNFYTVKSFNEVWGLSFDGVAFYADKIPFASYVTEIDVPDGDHVFSCTYVGGAFVETRTFTLPIQVHGNMSISLEKNSFSGMMNATVYDY